jgi:hypothetical protein
LLRFKVLLVLAFMAIDAKIIRIPFVVLSGSEAAKYLSG